MADARIERYREAVEAMREGRYAVDLPAGDNGDDAVGRLGRALGELARTLAERGEGSGRDAELAELDRQLARAQQELETRATHDPLTGVWNRGAILEILAKELARAHRQEQPVAVVLADLDRFQQVNDRLGHQVGDQVLHEVASRLSECLRASEYLGRYAGEEFIIVLSPGDERSAERVMERARDTVRALTLESGADTLRPTLSLGAGVVERATVGHVEAVVQAAERALQRAKDAGRDRYEVENVA